MIQSLCIYCASSSNIEQSYKDLAAVAGRFCADNNIEVVYGGGHLGLMGIVADCALAQVGRVVGVIPEFLTKLEVAHKGLSEMHLTQTMQERQSKMAELSDAFLILPGGLGTLAEFFEIVTWKSLKLHNKPIFVLNYDGYWDSLIEMLQQARDEGFMRQDLSDLFMVFDSFEAFKAHLLEAC